MPATGKATRIIYVTGETPEPAEIGRALASGHVVSDVPGMALGRMARWQGPVDGRLQPSVTISEHAVWQKQLPRLSFVFARVGQ